MNVNMFKAALAAKGMTQEQLAEKLGISANTLRLKIKRKGDFRKDEIASLYAIFGKKVTEDFLFN